MGFIDLHCHLLWDVDDGCRSPQETLLAARALAQAGYTGAAPSPHVQLRYAGGDAGLCRARLEEARDLLARERVDLALHAGGENMLDDDYLVRVDAGEPRGLGASQRYALVELPFVAAVPALPEQVARLRAANVTPILAHPERCLEFERPGRAAEAVRHGAALQLNLGALTGRHGRPARKLAEQFLEEGLYAVAATDLHTPEGAVAWIEEALETLVERAGARALARLCSENPRRALAGEELS
jgi:protein-tyrosine phosphatase